MSIPRGCRVAALLALLVPGALAAAVARAEPPVELEIRTSSKLDALFLLSVLADDSRFDRSVAGARDSWRARFAGDPAAGRALAAWRGEGARLACLLAPVGGDDLESLAAALERPEALAGLADGAPDPSFAALAARVRERLGELRACVGFLVDQGFEADWRREWAEPLATAVQGVRAALARTDARRLCAGLGVLLDREPPPPRVYVCALAGTRGWLLRGGAVALGPRAAWDAGYLLAMELCRQVELPADLGERLGRLAAVDPDYARASDRIQGLHRAAVGEEVVLAAALHLAVASGALSRRGALRRAASAFRDPDQPARAGAPLAAALFAALSAQPPATGFSHPRFVAEFLDRLAPGSLAGSFTEVVREVSGRAGLQVEPGAGGFVVTRVLPEFPAWSAGVRAFDRLDAVDGVSLAGRSMDEVLDLLAGPPGTPRALTIDRAGERVEVTVMLGEGR